jgi:hypothetical protein
MKAKSLKARIKAIPGGEGFWKSSTEETFHDVANDLISFGVSDDDIVDILAGLYSAVAEEFGA